MIDEGYIKYQCYWIERQSISEEDIAELNQWRRQLYQLGLIGQYENGIGFGNISIRIAQSNELIISGTQTGGIPNLTTQHYTRVKEFDWQQNRVTCEGLIQASSETLTHAAIYVAAPEVNAVVHVHHQQLWHKLINRVPTTDPNCPYGTPEMARELIQLCEQDEVKKQKIVIMSGHDEGILTFGKNLSEAADKLRDYL
jgi:L-ribulose-5-phosphate 4-epimerase